MTHNSHQAIAALAAAIYDQLENEEGGNGGTAAFSMDEIQGTRQAAANIQRLEHLQAEILGEAETLLGQLKSDGYGYTDQIR